MECDYTPWSHWSASCGPATRVRYLDIQEVVVDKPSCEGLQLECVGDDEKTQSRSVPECKLGILQVRDSALKCKNTHHTIPYHTILHNTTQRANYTTHHNTSSHTTQHSTLQHIAAQDRRTGQSTGQSRAGQ